MVAASPSDSAVAPPLGLVFAPNGPSLHSTLGVPSVLSCRRSHDRVTRCDRDSRSAERTDRTAGPQTYKGDSEPFARSDFGTLGVGIPKGSRDSPCPASPRLPHRCPLRRRADDTAPAVLWRRRARKSSTWRWSGARRRVSLCSPWPTNGAAQRWCRSAIPWMT